MRILIQNLTLALAATIVIFNTSCKHEPDVTPINNPNNPGDSNNVEITCSPDTVYFQNDIMPILASSCAYADCHDNNNPQEGIELTSWQSIMASGIVVTGDASESELFKVLLEDDPEDRMPYNMPPLSSEQIAAIRDWINQGAKNNQCLGECDTTIFTYSGAIKSIIDKNCVNCHKASMISGGVRLDSHGAVAQVAADGRLIGTITHTQGYTAMPFSSNPANQRKLKDCEITQVQKWIDAGSLNN